MDVKKIVIFWQHVAETRQNGSYFPKSSLTEQLVSEFHFTIKSNVLFTLAMSMSVILHHHPYFLSIYENEG